MQWTTHVHPMQPSYIDNVTVATLSLEKYERENTYTYITHTYVNTYIHTHTYIHTYIT